MGAPEFANADVAAVFGAYPPALRTRLLALRALIFKTAAATDGVGPLEEALKWGEPAYLTSKSKSGSTIRINTVRNAADTYALHFNCRTTLVAGFRELYPDTFTYAGDRSILFHVEDTVPRSELAHCIACALTYHRRRRA